MVEIGEKVQQTPQGSGEFLINVACKAQQFEDVPAMPLCSTSFHSVD